MGKCGGCGRDLPAGAAKCIYCGGLPAEPAGDLPLPEFDESSTPWETAAKGLEAEPVAPEAPPRVVPKVISAPEGAGEARFTAKERMIGAAVALGLTLLAAGACVYYWPRSATVDDEVRARFAPHIASYREAPSSAEFGAPRVVGKLLPIEPEDDPYEEERMQHTVLGPSAGLAPEPWEVSRVYGLLDADLVAETPEEVGTVALIDCDERVVGHYDDGGTPGTQWVCQIELVDVASSRRVDRIAIYGGPPPRTTATGGIRTGSHPREAIARYLDSLPRT